MDKSAKAKQMVVLDYLMDNVKKNITSKSIDCLIDSHCIKFDSKYHYITKLYKKHKYASTVLTVDDIKNHNIFDFKTFKIGHSISEQQRDSLHIGIHILYKLLSNIEVIYCAMCDECSYLTLCLLIYECSPLTQYLRILVTSIDTYTKVPITTIKVLQSQFMLTSNYIYLIILVLIVRSKSCEVTRLKTKMDIYYNRNPRLNFKGVFEEKTTPYDCCDINRTLELKQHVQKVRDKDIFDSLIDDGFIYVGRMFSNPMYVNVSRLCVKYRYKREINLNKLSELITPNVLETDDAYVKVIHLACTKYYINTDLYKLG